MICQKCGLPKELCICETIAKEAQKIKVYVVEKRFKKKLTVVKGIDVSRINIKALMKKMKSSLACGGTYKNDEIELQGDHRERVKEILIKEGFPREMIEVR
ncbi:MAG TPA: stress response translation initiation inhibitor YciH [archaeon]|nr:stress response translation initiation inhibitor YciH [archaeon]